MKVSSIVKKKVDFITPDSTFLDASKVIFGHHHRGLPVVKGKNKKLVGFITQQDILSQLFPTIGEFMEDYVHERDFEAMEKKALDVLTRKVKNVIGKKVISIHIDDPILKAESIMKINHISRLPVVDSKGNLIGIISKGDIFRALVSPGIRGFE
ncbi:MAG: CBS domain-containing protein [Candidatus Levybacteria bacterium]|nr:CBS domain-containing protein [Candidatus Levybacteria bacterium]